MVFLVRFDKGCPAESDNSTQSKVVKIGEKQLWKYEETHNFGFYPGFQLSVKLTKLELHNVGKIIHLFMISSLMVLKITPRGYMSRKQGCQCLLAAFILYSKEIMNFEIV